MIVKKAVLLKKIAMQTALVKSIETGDKTFYRILFSVERCLLQGFLFYLYEVGPTLCYGPITGIAI